MHKKTAKKKKMSHKALFPACAFIATVIGIQPAFAGATADLLYSIIGIIIAAIAKLLVSGLEIIMNLLLLTMTTSINDLEAWGLLAGFNTFSGIIKAIALGIASLAVLWQLATILFGPYLDIKQTKSVGSIFARTLIFIPLTYVIQPVAFTAFSEMQKIYTSILNGYSAASNNAFLVQLSNQINMDTFLEDLMVTGAAASTQVGAAMVVFDALSGALQAMISTIIAAGFMVLILWNLLKLVFEIVQRFVVMIVYVYLTPLAAACGVIGDGEIPKKSLTLFISSGVLWILNVWCVGVACSLIRAYSTGMANGILGVFSWGFVTYGFLKIAQQLDDIFTTVGATNIKLSGSLLDDILSMKHMSITPAGAMASVANAYKTIGGKLLNGMVGKMPSNPLSPTSAGLAPVAGKTIGSNRNNRDSGIVSGGSTPTPSGGPPQVGPAGTVNGLPNKGSPTASATARKNATEKHIKSIDSALNMSPDSEEKDEKLKNIYNENPKVFNSPDFKDWMSENQLGLDKDKQALVDSAYNPESGEMSGIVATIKGDGKIALDKVSDLESTHAGAGNERAINAQQSSLSAVRAKAGEAQRVSDFTMSNTTGNSGRDFATFSYTDKDGVQHTAQMERLDTLSGGHSAFKMVLDDGREPVINAPKDASAHDVASMVNGTASTSVQDSFNNYHAGGPGIVNAQAATNVDTNIGGSVMNGTAFENSPNTVATISGASGENAVSLERIERGTAPGANDVWSATKNGIEIGRMTVEKDTGAVEVMSRVMSDSSEDFASVRSNAGLDTDDPYVSFSRSSSPTGPEPMHCAIEPNASGTRTNGSTWHSFGEVAFETDDSGHEQVSFSYNVRGENGLFVPTTAKVADTGMEVFREVSGPDKDGIIDIAATGKVYVVSGAGISSGGARIVVDNNANTEDIASAILVGGNAASSISGVENIREAMGITNTMNAGSENSLKRFFNMARNKSSTNTKSNPVEAK